MSIPRIAPYDLPTDLPRNRVDWRPDPERAVLLVHDMQNYFVDAYAGAPLSEVVGNIGLLRTLGIPVVYSAQPGDQAAADRGLLTDFWGQGMSADPRDTAIVDALTPETPTRYCRSGATARSCAPTCPPAWAAGTS
jgi:bifunctional isochorismate lyase/aryl carrier protein